MKTLLTILLATLVSSCTAQPPKEISTTSDAAIFAKNWVALLNGRDYAAAWNDTSEEFKEELTLEKWTEAENSARNFTPAPNTTKAIEAFRFKKLPKHNLSGDLGQVEVTTKSTSGATWHDLVMIVKRNGKWLVIGHNPWKTN